MTFSLTSILSKDKVYSPVLCYSKKKAFELISKNAASFINLPKEKIFDLLIKREDVGNTYVANSVSFPHAVIPDECSEYCCVIVLNQQILYNSIDSSYSEILFPLFLHQDTITQNSNQITKFIEKISDTKFVKHIKTIKNLPNQVYDSFIDFDK
ncbi:MAG: PTS sugar transporter subunit IIA [Succinivibrionaceae bacterium]